MTFCGEREHIKPGILSKEQSTSPEPSNVVRIPLVAIEEGRADEALKEMVDRYGSDGYPIWAARCWYTAYLQLDISGLLAKRKSFKDRVKFLLYRKNSIKGEEARERDSIFWKLHEISIQIGQAAGSMFEMMRKVVNLSARLSDEFDMGTKGSSCSGFLRRETRKVRQDGFVDCIGINPLSITQGDALGLPHFTLITLDESKASETVGEGWFPVQSLSQTWKVVPKGSTCGLFTELEKDYDLIPDPSLKPTERPKFYKYRLELFT